MDSAIKEVLGRTFWQLQRGNINLNCKYIGLNVIIDVRQLKAFSLTRNDDPIASKREQLSMLNWAEIF